MTPNEIEVLIHYHTCAGRPHPRETAPAVFNATEIFIANDLIERVGLGTYRTTPRGAAAIALLCQTPWPVLKFIDPRDGKEVGP